MSEKEASITVTGFDEDTEIDVDVTTSVDFINPGNVYIRLASRDISIKPFTLVLPEEDARVLAEFILREA